MNGQLGIHIYSICIKPPILNIQSNEWIQSMLREMYLSNYSCESQWLGPATAVAHINCEDKPILSFIIFKILQFHNHCVGTAYHS